MNIPTHPRLLAGDSTWTELSARRKTDASLDRFLRNLETAGRRLLGEPPVRREMEGKRLLAVSREAFKRILLWSFNHRLTADRAFLRRAEEEMLAAARFADWNPAHFLDTAEMTAALAIGYDWLFDELAGDSRRKIREAIRDKGLRAFLEPPVPHCTSWQVSRNNWNQVCFAGLALGALAIGDEEIAVAGEVLDRAKASARHGFAPYAPDGVYPEGPGYWSYGTTYGVILIAALESALGTDWGLASSPGFLASAGFQVQVTAPSGRAFNYSDGREPMELQPALFWFARRLEDPGLVASQLSKLEPVFGSEAGDASRAETLRFLPLTALWWVDPSKRAEPRLPLGWHGKGEQPLVIFRSSWTDPEAMYLGLKGGSASLSHAHMDAGSFVFEAKGERWARDLGMQEYFSLESKGIDLWNGAQDSERWKVFRLNNFSHNVLTIDGQLHRVDGAATVVQFSEEAGTAVVDLTPVFAGQAARVRRAFAFRPGRHVLVRDELEGLKSGSRVRWAMATDAEIRLDGREGTLGQNGKSVRVKLLVPREAVFEVVPADPPADDFNAANPGSRLLLVRVAAPASGRVEIAVMLEDGGGNGDEPLAKRPIDGWPGSAGS